VVLYVASLALPKVGDALATSLRGYAGDVRPPQTLNLLMTVRALCLPLFCLPRVFSAVDGPSAPIAVPTLQPTGGCVASNTDGWAGLPTGRSAR
jgi:hypothetical protein